MDLISARPDPGAASFGHPRIRRWRALSFAASRATSLALALACATTACATSGADANPPPPLAAASGAPDGGIVTPPPSRRGLIVPGDPASGTTQLGGSQDFVTHTGTNGTRVSPVGSDGK